MLLHTALLKQLVVDESAVSLRFWAINHCATSEQCDLGPAAKLGSSWEMLVSYRPLAPSPVRSGLPPSSRGEPQALRPCGAHPTFSRSLPQSATTGARKVYANGARRSATRKGPQRGAANKPPQP